VLLGSERCAVLAGGTDLLVNGRPDGSLLVDLGAIRSVAEVREDGDMIRIGATATYTDLAGSDLVTAWCDPLRDAALEIGGRQIQNQGTIGGNVANASPAGDTLPVLAVLDATVELSSARGIRTVPIDQFCTGPGATVRRPDELITAIVVPKRPRDDVAFFVKVGPRRAQAISIASVAVRAQRRGDRLGAVRLSYGAVSPVVARDRAVEAVLESAPLTPDLVRAAAATSSATPITDVRATASYRRRLLAGTLLRGFSDGGPLGDT
jgi:CO/xanthine dehydrogenase FAD-binding subunit